MTPRARALVSALLPLLLVAPVMPLPVAAQALPTGQDVLLRYQQAIGGAAAFARHSSMHSTGEFSMPGAGITGAVEAFSARPDRSVTRVAIPGVGEIRSGFTNDVAWSVDPMQGPRLLQGSELMQARDEAQFESVLRPAGNFKTIETVEKTTVNEQECYLVRLVWNSDRETRDCFHAVTGLLLSSVARMESSLGAMDATTLYEDYREFGGILLPTRIRIQAMGVEQVLRITSIEFGAVPDERFIPPPEIQALIQ